MRGGYPELFDPDGSEPPEPSGIAVLVWSGIAALALLFAVVALVYGLPRPSDSPPTAEVDIAPLAETGIVGRTDFSMRSDQAGKDADIAKLRIENAALRKTVGSMQAGLALLGDRLDGLERSLGSVTGSVTRTPIPAPERPAPTAAPPPPDGATAKVRRTAFGVELGVYADLASAEAAWRRILAEQPALFADLEPVASVRDRDGALELLLVAGPFATADDAAARCVQAVESSLTCLPAFFLGQPLAIR